MSWRTGKDCFGCAQVEGAHEQLPGMLNCE